MKLKDDAIYYRKPAPKPIAPATTRCVAILRAHRKTLPFIPKDTLPTVLTGIAKQEDVDVDLLATIYNADVAKHLQI